LPAGMQRNSSENCFCEVSKDSPFRNKLTEGRKRIAREYMWNDITLAV
jgi:hypothetical protein